MDYEACYYNAKSRYYNACTEINSCQRRIYDLKNYRRGVVSRINQLQADVRNTETALHEMAQVLRSEEPLNSKLAAVANRTDQAAANFSAMAAASDITGRNLSDVYGGEASKTHSELENILNTLKLRRKEVEDRLADLQNRLRQARAELDDTDAGIHAAESEQREWESIRRSAGNDMEYYKSKMQAMA